MQLGRCTPVRGDAAREPAHGRAPSAASRRAPAGAVGRCSLFWNAAAERFLAEARILARLNHPNVVTVHDVGEADGLFYYVMEYLEVPTLAVRLTEGPLAAAAALKLGRDLLDGLEAAHVAGIVHCDV
jgi:serine/threonine protein kinase